MTITTARVAAGVREGGQFTGRSRADAGISLAPGSELEQLIDRLERGELGEWDEDSNARLVDSEELGIRGFRFDFPLISNIHDQLLRWEDRGRPQPPIVDYPVSDITGIQQGELRADVLAWYLRQPDDSNETWDDDVSFYGGLAPMIFRVPGVGDVILDGCHRFARAKLTGAETFRAQIMSGHRRA